MTIVGSFQEKRRLKNKSKDEQSNLCDLSEQVVRSRGVPDNKSGPVSGRISGKCPVRYPAGLFTMSGRILS